MEKSTLEKVMKITTSNLHTNLIEVGKKLVDLMLFSLAIKHTKI